MRNPTAPSKHAVEFVDIGDTFHLGQGEEFAVELGSAGTVISLGAIMWRMGSVVSSSMDSAIEYLSR